MRDAFAVIGRFTKKLLLAVVMLTLSTTVLAASLDREALEKTAVEQKLGLDSYWLALGHYKTLQLSLSDYRSRVNDPLFFLANDGRTDPEQELLATIRAALDDYQGDSNEDPLCRFPARYRWLEQKLHLAAYITRRPDCSDYKSWRQMVNADSVALVYASAHLNGPSSMYGHTLLRIDPPGFKQSDTALLSWAASFGANIPANENSILYAYRGIFGGYPGKFNVLPYLDKLKEYSRIENRDLWEYQLNLTAQEVDALVVHLWELKNINFDYFFFDENCSYQLLELLNVARPGQAVTDDYPLVVIPVDTVRGVIKHGFVSSVTYRPSVSTKLEHNIAQLTPGQQDTALQLSRDIQVLDTPTYQNNSDAEKLQIANVAYDYTRYSYRRSAADEQVVQGSYRLLQEINSLPRLPAAELAVPFHPENGHESAALTVAGGREDDVNYLDIEMRASFHDLQDNISGYMPGSSINMGTLALRAQDDESVQLQKLDLIEITSLSPRNKFFKPVSWRTSVGWDRQRTYGVDELAAQANGGGGLTYGLTKNILAYGLLTGRLEYNEGFEHNWQAGAGIASGLLFYTPVGTASIGVDGYQYLDDYYRYKTFALFNWAIAKDYGLQFSAEHHERSEESYNMLELSLRKFY